MMTQYSDGMRASSLVFVRQKAASQCRVDTKRRKVISRNQLSVYAFCLRASVQAQRRVGKTDQAVEDIVLIAVVFEIRIGESRLYAIAKLCSQYSQPFRLLN